MSSVVLCIHCCQFAPRSFAVIFACSFLFRSCLLLPLSSSRVGLLCWPRAFCFCARSFDSVRLVGRPASASPAARFVYVSSSSSSTSSFLFLPESRRFAVLNEKLGFALVRFTVGLLSGYLPKRYSRRDCNKDKLQETCNPKAPLREKRGTSQAQSRDMLSLVFVAGVRGNQSKDSKDQ